MSDTRVSSIAARIPQPSVSFVGADGQISREWLYYMIVILKRTGGEPGISFEVLQKQILALMVEVAMSDVADPPPGPSIAFDVAFSDEPVEQPASLPVLLGHSLSDDVPGPPLNSFLSALLVADPS